MSSERRQPATPLGQDLKDVPVGLCHDLEHAPDVVVRNLLVEEVAHDVHKDALGPAPAERKGKLV